MKINAGLPEPLGFSYRDGNANFALFSAHAASASLCLFFPSSATTPDEEIPLQGPTDRIWHLGISGLPQGLCYAYRIDGQERLLADPYTRVPFANTYSWEDFSKTPRGPFLCRATLAASFDWQNISPPRIPLKELIIYEMHVRGFTAHPSSHARNPGTYAGVIEKIPYLKQLGVNAVELMPIFEFDETHSATTHPDTHQPLPNYWGYSPISFFLPMSRYAQAAEHTVEEFKTMVRELHRAGIEILLDVVYNHTGEDQDFIVSWRGIDKNSYYMLNPQGRDRNYTGCGNTFQVNGSAGMHIILESLRYWASEMRVDGFRFDLASILMRGTDGKPMAHPPILQSIANDPVLRKVKLIAEPWDAAGLYQPGEFPKWGNWSSWNGPFRDHVRRFIKGTDQEAGPFATALCGSQSFYTGPRTPLSSINFITSHDGFSLRDLVSYQQKHNEDNGEQNRDGSNSNDNWNCGAEGPTKDTAIAELRERQMRNFWLSLFLAQGIPMMLMGDEIGRTRKGNNNAYSQDTEINWFNWRECEQKGSLLQFVSSLIAFRKHHPILRRTSFLTPKDIDWHGTLPLHPNWSNTSRFVAFTLKDAQPLYVAFNANYRKTLVTLPPSYHWHQVVNTADPWECQYLAAPENGPLLGTVVEMIPYSALVAKAL